MIQCAIYNFGSEIFNFSFSLEKMDPFEICTPIGKTPCAPFSNLSCNFFRDLKVQLKEQLE
jgi:hypothetical protein